MSIEVKDCSISAMTVKLPRALKARSFLNRQLNIDLIPFITFSKILLCNLDQKYYAVIWIVSEIPNDFTQIHHRYTDAKQNI